MVGTDIQWLNTLLNFLGVIIGGGALGVFLNYRHKMRQLDLTKEAQDHTAERSDFEAILAAMSAQINALEKKIVERDNRIQRMEDEITGLRIARDLDPFPHWVVGAENFTYLYVNREFERVFLAPLGKNYRDILGKAHEDFWPEPFCKTLYALNEAARTRPDGTARARTALDIPKLGEAQVTVHKFPVRAQPSGAIIAWAGYITGVDMEERQMG